VEANLESGTETVAGTTPETGAEPETETGPETDEDDGEGLSALMGEVPIKTRRLSDDRHEDSNVNLQEQSIRGISMNSLDANRRSFESSGDSLGSINSRLGSNTHSLNSNTDPSAYSRDSLACFRDRMVCSASNSSVCPSPNSMMCSSSNSKICSSPNNSVCSSSTANSSLRPTERLSQIKDEQLSEEETSGDALAPDSTTAAKLSNRHENRRPPELSLAAIHSNSERQEVFSATRQDHSPYSPHHPLRDYYYQSLYARFAAYPLHLPGYPPSPPFFAAGPGVALPFAAMSPSLSPGSPLSSPSPYSRQQFPGGHFDFSKSHLL